MRLYELLPNNFINLGIIDQIDWMIDVYGMAMKMEGGNFINNINMLQMVKKEIQTRNVSFNIFDIMGNSITKEKFIKLKTEL